jgi:hypothetical protein
VFLEQIRYELFIVIYTIVISYLGNGTAWQYGSVVSPQSSVTILAGSQTSNQTYQFMVSMVNRQNSSYQATGYLLVQVEDTNSPMISVA